MALTVLCISFTLFLLLGVPVAFSIAPFLQVSPTLLAAISAGMAVGWLGHALGLLKKGDVPCTTAA